MAKSDPLKPRYKSNNTHSGVEYIGHMPPPTFINGWSLVRGKEAPWVEEQQTKTDQTVGY